MAHLQRSSPEIGWRFQQLMLSLSIPQCRTLCRSKLRAGVKWSWELQVGELFLRYDSTCWPVFSPNPTWQRANLIVFLSIIILESCDYKFKMHQTKEYQGKNIFSGWHIPKSRDYAWLAVLSILIGKSSIRYSPCQLICCHYDLPTLNMSHVLYRQFMK